MIGDKTLQVAIDRYLKSVRPQAHAEIAQAVREALSRGELGKGTVDTAVALTSEKIGLNVTIYGKIEF
ncbi:MAG: DUF6494 family protein [Pseudolabrys sp.]|jgi:hypothetical protein